MVDESSGEKGRLMGKGRLIERVVVGVFGNAQHGKNTVAELLMFSMAEKGKRAEVFALADPLKHVARHLLGMPDDIAWGDPSDIQRREQLRMEWRKYGRNAREWMQWIGTELGRDMIDEDLWVDRAVDRVVNDVAGNEFFFITDCRFYSERTGLRDKLAARFVRFVPIRVYRPSIPIDRSHPSETEVASMTAAMFDHVIDNDSDMDALRDRVEEFVTTKLGIVSGRTSI